MNNNNDDALRDLVKDYDDKCKDYFSITFMCIEGGAEALLLGAAVGLVAGPAVAGIAGAISNDLGVMTADEECLRIYALKKNCSKLCAENVESVIALYYDTFTKLEIKKFLIWNTIKIHFMFEHESKPRKIKIVLSDKAMKIKGQKENVKKLIDILKKYKNSQLNL